MRFSGTETPYSAYGRAYMRVGDEDRQLSKQEQENLIRNKQRVLAAFECLSAESKEPEAAGTIQQPESLTTVRAHLPVFSGN